MKISKFSSMQSSNWQNGMEWWLCAICCRFNVLTKNDASKKYMLHKLNALVTHRPQKITDTTNNNATLLRYGTNPIQMATSLILA